MQTFTIREIENLTGIKAHTWRIWEKRYPLFQTKRNKGEHHTFSSKDMEQFLQIAFLYHNGWKVSKLAKLPKDALLNETNKVKLEEGNYKTYLLKLIEATINYNEKVFSQILDNLADKIGFETCVTEICYPFLQRLGQFWTTYKVTPAQEHFSYNIMQNKIIAVTEKLNKPNMPTELLLFSPQKEFNELPLLFLNYLMRKNGWGVIFLGSNAKLEVLQQFTDHHNLRFLFMHQITNISYLDADDYFDTVCRIFPDKKIIASGTIAREIQRTFTNLILLKSDKEIIDFINR